MENRRLPNANKSLIFSIASIIGACCSAGFGGAILSGISLYLIKKDTKTYAKNPEQYDNFSQLKTAKIIAIVGLVLSVILIIIYFYLLATDQLMSYEGYRKVIETSSNQ